MDGENAAVAAQAAAQAATYWDVEAALADQALVQVKYEVPCKGAAHILLPGSAPGDIVEGTEAELPLWLAAQAHSRGEVTVKCPMYFGRRMQRRLQAGASCEDLRFHTPYFYSVGCILGRLGVDERIGSVVQSTWQSRYKDLLVDSLKGDERHDSVEMMGRLTIEEQKLFDAGHSSALAFESYRYTKATMQRAAALKRKWGHEDKENAVL